VQQKLQIQLGDDYKVCLAMRYQSPSIASMLNELKDADEIIVLPLFPQYASATAGTVHQKVMESIQGWNVIPKLTFIDSFYDHPGFIQAFCERAKEYQLDRYDHILFSFHGLPERHIRKADPSGKCLSESCCQSQSKYNSNCYKSQCFTTARSIATGLGLDEKDYTICFQSRLGRDPWIQPYTQDMLGKCVEKGYRRMLVFCPAFVCDCLETTCEIAYEYAHEFKLLGGEELQLVEGLNDHPAWITALKQLVLS
jgi:ferrochelatase